MKKLIVIVLVCITSILQAQEYQTSHSTPIPVEVTVGNKSSLYQMIVVRQFGKKKQFGFFNLLNYEIDYKQETPDSYIVQSIFSYNFNRHFSLGAGANLKAFGGFKPLLAGAYTFFNRNFGVVIQPSVELDKDGVSEIFALFEWHPKKFKKINPYFSLQGITSYKTKDSKHDFSYVYIKTGIQLGTFRLGPALNLQEIGNGSYSKSIVNMGGFISIILN